jgi:hypothetical protein
MDALPILHPAGQVSDAGRERLDGAGHCTEFVEPVVEPVPAKRLWFAQIACRLVASSGQSAFALVAARQARNCAPGS